MISTLTLYRAAVYLCNIKHQNIFSTQYVGCVQLIDMLANIVAAFS